jgi:hypothetical protein
MFRSVESRLVVIAALGFVIAVSTLGAQAGDADAPRFSSELVDDFLTTDDSNLLSDRAMMPGTYPFFAKSWLPASSTASCTTALLESSQVNANFPMTDAQRNSYASLLRTALAKVKPKPVKVLAKPAAKPGCMLVSSFTVATTDAPFILVLEVSYAVLLPDSTGNRMAWAVAVRHSVQVPSEPPKTPIANFLLDDFRHVASAAAARYLTEEQDRPILE